MKAKTEVFCCGREYDLYIALLYSFANSTKIVLILSKELAKDQGLADTLISYEFIVDVILIPDSGLHEKIFFSKKGKVNTLTNIILLKKRMKDVYVNRFNLLEKLNPYFESCVFNLFFVNTALKLFCYTKASKVRFIEEGAGIYKARDKKLYRFFWYLCFLPNKLGKERKVFEILLSKPENWIADKKVKKWSPSDYEKNLTVLQKEFILSIFSSCNFKMFNSNKPKAIIITQPLSEDGHCTEKQKVLLYKKYVNMLKGRYTIFIKTHPREVTSYTAFGQESGVEVIKEQYPIDLLNLVTELSFEVGVTVSSTGLDNLSNVNKKIYIAKKGIISTDLFDN